MSLHAHTLSDYLLPDSQTINDYFKSDDTFDDTRLLGSIALEEDQSWEVSSVERPTKFFTLNV